MAYRMRCEMALESAPGRKGSWGRATHDNRRFINTMLWILRTGAPWRALPADYGDWENTHRRFMPLEGQGAVGGTAEQADERARFRVAHD